MFEINAKEQLKKRRSKMLFGILIIAFFLLILNIWSHSSFLRLFSVIRNNESLNIIFLTISIIAIISASRKKHYSEYFVLLDDETISINSPAKLNILNNKIDIINLKDIKYIFYPKYNKTSYIVLNNKKYIPLRSELEDYDVLISNLERKKIPVIERAQSFFENLIIVKMNLKSHAFILVVLLILLLLILTERVNNPYYKYKDLLSNEDIYLEDDLQLEEDLYLKEDIITQYSELSDYEFSLGNNDLALDYITKAIDLEPESSYYYSNRAYIYESMEEHEKAIADLSKRIELTPEVAYCYEERANCYRHIEEYDKSLADYAKAIELEPSYSWYYTGIAKVYEDLEEFDLAILNYTTAIEMDLEENYVRDYYYVERSYCYSKSGQFQKALQDVNMAIEIDPNSGYNYTVRAYVYEDLENWELAIEDYSRAIELNRDYYWIYEQRGNVYNELGETEKAEKDFKKYEKMSKKFGVSDN